VIHAAFKFLYAVLLESAPSILVARGETIMETLSELEQRYHLTCPECGTKFWAEPQLAKTSVFDGHLQGFRCPKCDEVVPWKTEE